MNLAEKIELITIEYTQDELGEWVETQIKDTVFAIIGSVSASEFFQAGLQGFKPEYQMTVWQTEYSGQELVEYNGKTYSIYRSYRRDDGRIELYVTEKKGEENDT